MAKPETLEAPSKVLKEAPTARKNAVIVIVTLKVTIQKVKKALAEVLRATMK